MVKNIDRDGLDIEVNKRLDRIAAKTVIWAGGVTASPLGKLLASKTNAEIDRGGRVKVKPDLTIPNFPDIYVVGDLAASFDAKGNPLPGLAQVAMQGGTFAGKSILRKVNGKAPLPRFKYFDKGSMAVIGRASAVANTFGVHVSGLLAWLMWAFIHLMYLVQFQSRVLVFVQWAIQDLTFNRGARLITGVAPTDFNFNEEVATHRNTTERKAGEVA
jgi:NADH dehydrogenase